MPQNRITIFPSISERERSRCYEKIVFYHTMTVYSSCYIIVTEKEEIQSCDSSKPNFYPNLKSQLQHHNKAQSVII